MPLELHTIHDFLSASYNASVPLALPVPSLKFLNRRLFPGKHPSSADQDSVPIVKTPHCLLSGHPPRLPTIPWNIKKAPQHTGKASATQSQLISSVPPRRWSALSHGAWSVGRVTHTFFIPLIRPSIRGASSRLILLLVPIRRKSTKVCHDFRKYFNDSIYILVRVIAAKAESDRTMNSSEWYLHGS